MFTLEGNSSKRIKILLGLMLISSLTSLMIIGIFGSKGQAIAESGLQATANNASLIRSQMQVDMLHDALYGNVLDSMLLTYKPNDSAHADLQKSAKDNAETMRSEMQKIIDNKADEHITNIALGIKPMIDEYTEIALLNIDANLSSDVSREKNFDRFLHLYAKLADELGAFGDSLEETVNTIEKTSLTNSQNATHALNVAFGSSLVILILLFATLARNILLLVSRQEVMINHIKQNANTLDDSSRDLHHASCDINEQAEKTSNQADLVASTAKHVNSRLEAIAVSAKELNTSIVEIAKNASNASTIANKAVTVAKKTNDSVNKLDESSTAISRVVELITSIAQQTKLLALNATIEAARAGEAGKGFVVVANEVKELAKETADATKDIAAKIEAIQSDTHDSVAAISEITDIINQINQMQNMIASAVEEQSATTNEIGRTVSEAAEGSADIAENIAIVAQTAQFTSQTAAHSTDSAARLSSMAADLKSLTTH